MHGLPLLGRQIGHAALTGRIRCRCRRPAAACPADPAAGHRPARARGSVRRPDRPLRADDRRGRRPDPLPVRLARSAPWPPGRGWPVRRGACAADRRWHRRPAPPSAAVLRRAPAASVRAPCRCRRSAGTATPDSGTRTTSFAVEMMMLDRFAVMLGRSVRSAVRHRDPHRIGDDVVGVGRVQAHGVDRAAEVAAARTRRR